MQFQGLENPIQVSPHHSHTLSGFVTDMMSLKPAKGRTPSTCSGLCVCSQTEEIGGSVVRLQGQMSVRVGSVRHRGLG